MYKTLLTGLFLLLVGFGCTEPATPDSNTQVFRTVDQVAAERRAAQEKSWKQSAIDVLREERPDLTANPENELVISLFADGMRHRLDFSELTPALTAQPDHAYAILREFISRQLIPFDQERLAKIGFESVRKRVRPMLLNGADLQELTTQLGSQPPTRTIFGDLYWVPVARWDAPRPATPIGPKVLAAWKISMDEASKLALENLAADPVEGSFEVTSFGTLGKVGTLRETTDPAILLSPNFLAAARRELGTSDGLALLLGAPDDVRFMPAGEKRLLDSIYPNWKSITNNNRRALARQPLLLSEAGIAGLNYVPQITLIRPASMPTTNPMQRYIERRPSTRPAAKPAGKPYIVR